MARRTKDSVVVITGGSSGIGRATAHAFAERGAWLVLAARRSQALEQVASECQARGAEALAIPTDVTDEEAVQSLALRAIETFGRVDTWVGNAAVSAFGRFEEVPSEVFRRVLEVNLQGNAHGARAILPYFREQGRGTLILVSSVVAEAPQPHTSAYVTSKWAIQGLSKALRLEASLEAADIRICHVKPASIDTPLFQQAANYSRRRVKPLDPVLPPERVARAIVRVARRRRREVTVGTAGRFFSLQHRWAPALFERAAARHVDRHHFQDGAAEPTEGNLFRAMPQHAAVHGGWARPGTGWPAVALGVGVVLAAPLVARALRG